MGCTGSSAVHTEERNHRVTMAAEDGHPTKREEMLSYTPESLRGANRQCEDNGRHQKPVERSSNGNQPTVHRTEDGFIVRRSPPVNSLPESIMPMTELFNLMSAGFRISHITDPYYMLILDCREHGCYTRNHIITARHHRDLDELFESGLLRRYTIIVVYGENDSDNTTKDIFHKIKNMGLYVQIVEGGFSDFNSFAPFLCTDTPIKTELQRRGIIVYPSLILKDTLYQGNAIHAQSEDVINNLKITHVVNITTEVGCPFQDSCKYLHLKFADESGVKLSVVFEKAADFIADALEDSNARVLVHCVMGVSRSSSITLAYLMKYHGWSFGDAFKHLKGRRSVAAPNTGFITQLSEYEQQLFGEKITDPEEIFYASAYY